jgi:hypothetical protein
MPVVVALIGLGWVVGAATPASAAGFTVRASTSLTGAEGNGFSSNASITDDGRYVTFSSQSSNLVAGDTNSHQDVFVYDRNTQVTTLVSVDSGGGPTNGDSETPWITPDGRYVVYSSDATDLVAGDTNEFFDVFLRDLQTNTTQRVSLTENDLQIEEGHSYEPSISDDGTKIEFSSDAGDVVTDDLNDSEDIFVRNLTAGTTTRVSVATNGTETDFGAYEGSIAGGGGYVVFTTDTGLVTTDLNDEDDVYRTTLSSGSTVRVSPAFDGLGGGYTGSISDAGQFIAFVSDYQLSNQPSTDTNDLPDVYVRDMNIPQTRRVSVDSAGGIPNHLSLAPTVSDDGRYVAYFTLATDLGGTDTNGTFDIWIRDRTLSTNTRVSIDAGGGDPDGAAELPVISGDGGFVAFQSLATDLGPLGETGNVDVFVRSLANDVTAPTVTITTPVNAATYARGASVLANYSCSDNVGGSGIISCAGPVANGAAIDTTSLGLHTFTVNATDGQGNPASANRTYTVVDDTDPTIALTAPVDGANYNQYATVFADYSCSDEVGGSGLAACVGTVADGAPINTATLGAHSFTVNAADNAGNTAMTTVNYTVLDVAGPDITISTPVDGATYGRGSTVIADFACTDEVGGSGVASCIGTVADGAAINTATLGAHTFTVNATDNSGNSTTRNVGYTVADNTAPTATISVPADGSDYGRGTTVLADFACADDPGGSGIASCVGTVADGAAIATGTLGSQGFTVDATDNAGNPFSITVNYDVVDITDPTATILIPLDGGTYDRGSTVLADFSCADDVGGSGIASCLGTVADGAAIDTATLGAHAFSVVATDNAGNDVTVIASYTVVDAAAPTITIVTPADGANYNVGQAIFASYSCADEAGGSGLATCAGPVANGAAINTSTPGPHSFTVNATDVAGNNSSEIVNYTVTASVLVSVGDATLVENDSGTQSVKLSVVLNQAAAGPTSVHYSTQNTGSAGSSDYKTKSGTLNFKAGQVYKVVTVVLSPDTVIEPNETFSVVLDTPVGMATADDTGVVTILDDDANAVQRAAASDASVSEGVSGSARKVNFIVALAQPSAGGVSVQYSVAGVTATGGTTASAGTDFKTRSGTLVFSAGQRFKVVVVTIYGDATIESTETFEITLSSPVATAIGRAVGTGTITNDD